MRLSEVAGKVGLTFSGHDLEIAAVNTLALAGPDELAPLLDRKHLPELAHSRAGAVLCEEKFAPAGRTCLLSKHLKLDWARVVAFFARPQGCLTGISPQAFIHPEAVLGPGVTVYPFAFVGARATVGEGSTLFPGVYVGEDCALGQDCILYPNSVLLAGTVLGARAIIHAGAVLGSDGYGYAQSPAGHVKVPQVGVVIVGDDVEIGANSCVDRAALDTTRIGDGTKIDNLAQVAHNVQIGKHCLIVSQAGVAGSARLGNGVVLGGQVGVRDNISLGDGVQVAGQSGVGVDLPAGATVGGSPSMDAATFLKMSLTLPKLPDLARRVRRLEKAVEQRLDKPKED